MAQRVVVMNGQRILQTLSDDKWITAKVGKAGQLKPGVHNLVSAVVAEPRKIYDGAILHTDGDYVYQQAGRAVVRHEARRFVVVPDVGVQLALQDEGGRIQVLQPVAKRGRGVRR